MDDLSGHLINGSGDWEVLSLSAIADVDERVQIGDDEFYCRRIGEALHPAHESLETLLKLRRDLGTYDFGAQYQQSPIPEGGAMLKSHWFRFYDEGLVVGLADLIRRRRPRDETGRSNLAIEEFLRFISPVQFSKPRFVRRDVDLDGVTLKKGQRIMA